jgi:hypothetical protein
MRIEWHIDAQDVADRAYYNFVSDGIQQLCAECDIYPTVFDAAVFASFDRGAWDEEKAAAG